MNHLIVRIYIQKGISMRKKRTLRDLSRKEIKKMAEHYAYSPARCSAEYLAEKYYNVSVNTFRKAIEKAVIESMVDRDTVYEMQKKASYNAYLHNGNPGKIRSIRHYDDLMEMRDSYMPSPKASVQLIEKLANSNLSLEEFAAKEVYTAHFVRKILYYCIEEDLISTRIFDLLKEKMYF